MKQKKEGKSLKLLLLIIVLIIIIITLVFFNYKNNNNNDFKNNILINKDKMETQHFSKEQLERAKKTIQAVKDRDKKAEEVNSGKISINDFKYLDFDNYFNYLKENNLFDDLEDEKYENRIQIAGNNILIPSYEIKNGKLVKIKEIEEKLKLIYTSVAKKDKNGNIIYNSGDKNLVKIEGPYLDGNLLIIAIDSKDGDITERITSEVKGDFKALQKGKKYEVTYKIKNRNIEEKSNVNIIIN